MPQGGGFYSGISYLLVGAVLGINGYVSGRKINRLREKLILNQPQRDQRQQRFEGGQQQRQQRPQGQQSRPQGQQRPQGQPPQQRRPQQQHRPHQRPPRPPQNP